MRVLVFGDSITQGMWDSQGGWVARIRSYYDRQTIEHSDYSKPVIFNLGVSADNTENIIYRLDVEAKARGRDDLAIVIAIGVNDSEVTNKVGLQPEEYLENLGIILAKSRAFTNKILFVGLTPCIEAKTNPTSWGDYAYTNTSIAEYQRMLESFCVQENIPFVPVADLFDNHPEYLPDGLHPNDKGHELMYNRIKPELDKLLNIKK